MKKTIGLVAILILLLPGLGFSDAISVRLAYFIPRAQSELWTIEFANMSFQKSDFQNASLGIFYEHFFSREISLLIGLDVYSQTRLGTYRDYVGYSFAEGDFAFPIQYYDGDFDISHNFSVSITPIQMSLKLTPLGRRSGFIPYIGGGVSLYIWSVKMRGDIIDFTDEWFYDDDDLGEVPIYGVYPTDARQESRFSVGFQGFAGVMFPIASRLALEAEFKYNYGKGSLGGSFEGFDNFDLGGYQVSVGVNYWF
jgi:opacity protein-like surface antigen